VFRLVAAEVATRAREHVVAVRVHERGDLGDASYWLWLYAASGESSMSSHSDAARLHHLEAVLRGHEVLHSPKISSGTKRT